MKILIVSLAAILLMGIAYYLFVQSDSDSTAQAPLIRQDKTAENADSNAQPASERNFIFRPPSVSEPGYGAARTAMAEKLSAFENPPESRLLITDTNQVAELFRTSNNIVKGEFGLGKLFDISLFEDQPCSFNSLLHPMTKAGSFWVLQAKCQERSHSNSVRMILWPKDYQLYVFITENGRPQAKSTHLTGDYVMALEEVKEQIELSN